MGQIPTDKTEEDLIPLFSPFGEIEKLTLVCTPEGKSRGCAMVQFRRWSDAERAAAAINGTTTMEGGRGRALVVHFANPRRLVGSGAAEPAITPRKLFVGQIPKAATEADVAAVFAPFGEIQQINILKSKGIHAGCAFVQLASWAACEAAIDALHEQRVLPGCEHPLVVKFADAKRPDNLAAKQHRSISLLGLNGMLGPGGMLTNHAYLSGELGHMPLPPHMPLGNPLTGAREDYGCGWEEVLREGGFRGNGGKGYHWELLLCKGTQLLYWLAHTHTQNPVQNDHPPSLSLFQACRRSTDCRRCSSRRPG